MNKVFGILYASREFQTKHIAEHIGATLREKGIEADVIEVREREKIHLERYSGVILAASVHMGKQASTRTKCLVSSRLIAPDYWRCLQCFCP